MPHSVNAQSMADERLEQSAHANIFDAFGNLFTGNLDAERSVASALQQQEFNRQEAQKTREFNAEQALLAFEREKDLYSKRYQLQVEDLKKAGLNPALAYNLGAGTVASPSASSTPIGGASAYSSQSGKGFLELSKMLNNSFKAVNGIALAEQAKAYQSSESLKAYLQLLSVLALRG